MKDQPNTLNQKKVGIAGYIWLLLACIAFSGVFRGAEGPLAILDFSTWVGQFGVISESAGAGIMGNGGTGVSNGFMQGLSVAPGVFTSVAFMTCVEHYGGLAAAQKLLSPIMKPVMGVSGAGALAFISNLQSSDASAAVVKSTVDSGAISTKERDILMASLYVAASTIGRFFSNGLVLFPYLTTSVGVLILLLIAMKILAANLMRAYIFFTEKKTTAAAA